MSQPRRLDSIPRMILLLGLFALCAPAVVSQADSERTPVAISLERSELPEIDQMQSWFRVAGQPVRVLASGKGPAEVVVVRDPKIQAYLGILAKASLDRALGFEYTPIDLSKKSKETWDPRILRLEEDAFVEAARESTRNWRQLSATRLTAGRDALRRACDLGEDVRLQFFSPLAAPVSRIAHQTNVFNLTTSMPVGDKGFLTFVEPAASLRFARRFADAVAVAGDELEAAAHRRAVVVLIEGTSQDESLYTVPKVRQHLRRLQIPVAVWWFGHGAFAGGWQHEYLISEEAGKVDPERDLESFEDACDDLKSTLEAQRIVWLEGLHFLEDIELTVDAQGIRLAGEPPNDD